MKQVAVILWALAAAAAAAAAPGAGSVASCTTAGSLYEACLPVRYYESMPRPVEAAPYFTRRPQAPHVTPEGMVALESEEELETKQGRRLVFRKRFYGLSADGKELTLRRLTLPALQPGRSAEERTQDGRVLSHVCHYRSTVPGVFVVHGQVIRFEQFPGGRIRAMYCGRLDADGRVADERPVYRAAESLGRVVFIGDSITHGVGAPSYRWALHKILTDCGVAYEEMGVEQGNGLPGEGVAPGAVYRGCPFRNLHCAMTSERAYEVSGRRRAAARLDGTALPDWLGLNAAYSGPQRLPAAPDTAFILIGTNDLLGDYEGRFDEAANLAEAKAALLDDEHGDMSLMVDALRRANAQVRIVVLAVPTWEYSRLNDRDSSYAALAEYNRALHRWAARKGVLFADVNRVLADAAQPVHGELYDAPGRGMHGFFYEQPGMSLHPSRQGDLLIAGVVAHTLGLPGRDLGLPIVSQRAERLGEMTQIAAGGQLVSGSAAAVAAVRIAGGVGSAAPAKLREAAVRISLGTAAGSGCLSISPGYITWGEDTVLYSGSLMHGDVDLLIVRVEGRSAEGIEDGYYVWLGDMLIGEALPPAPTGSPGLRVRNMLPRTLRLRFYAGE